MTTDDTAKMRREAEVNARGYINCKRRAINVVGDLADWASIVMERDKPLDEAATEFWADVHRSLDVLGMSTTERSLFLNKEHSASIPQELRDRYYLPTPPKARPLLTITEHAEVERLMTQNGFEARDTGGGFYAWQKSVSDDFFVRITAGEDRLYDRPQEPVWFVGLWDKESGWLFDVMQTPDHQPLGIVDLDDEVIGYGPMPLKSALDYEPVMQKCVEAQASMGAG